MGNVNDDGCLKAPEPAGDFMLVNSSAAGRSGLVETSLQVSLCLMVLINKLLL